MAETNKTRGPVRGRGQRGGEKVKGRNDVQNGAGGRMPDAEWAARERRGEHSEGDGSAGQGRGSKP